MLFSQPLKLERIEIAIANLPPTLVGTKLIHLSDLHYDGKSLSTELLLETIEKSNQENPDLVFLTGDFVTNIPNVIHNLIAHLKYLKSSKGIYACLGNHDLYFRHGKKMIIDALKSIDIQVLWNQIAYPFGEDLAIVGLPDFWSKDFNPPLVFQSIKPNLPRIVLSHNPDSAEVLAAYRVDLQLSGHTHGGQMIIPSMGPIPAMIFKLRDYFPPPLQYFIPYMRECSKIVNHWEWSQGWHQIGQNQLYVNRGLATYFPPGRLFCPPELTVITLNTH
jgi:predicted MPP superfamily phosphohydrolase